MCVCVCVCECLFFHQIKPILTEVILKWQTTTDHTRNNVIYRKISLTNYSPTSLENIVCIQSCMLEVCVSVVREGGEVGRHFSGGKGRWKFDSVCVCVCVCGILGFERKRGRETDLEWR